MDPNREGKARGGDGLTPPVKILHVITKLELGGAQQNTLFTCRELARRGHAVTLASGRGGALDGEAASEPFEFVALEHLRRDLAPLHDVRALAELISVVRARRPDVIHTHSSKAGAIGRWAGWAGGARHVVHTVHGWSFAEHMPRASRALYRVVEHLCALVTDHFVSVSRLDLELGIRLGMVRPDRGSVIRSGIDLADFRAVGPGRDAIRREWSIGADDVLVVNVSNFKPQKAPIDFVRAAGRAAREEPRLRFAFVGDGELRPQVEAAVRAEGLASRFALAGWRRDIPSVLRAADVFALTSLWEGLPRTVVQARACELPVVATAVNGTPEVVEDGVSGFLLAPHDIEGFARAFVLLARDPELRTRLGARGADHLDEFDATAMVDRQESLYRALVAGR